MRDYIVRSQGVSRVVDVNVVDIVAREERGFVGKPVVEADHSGIFANRVAGHQVDLVGGAVQRDLSGRVCVHQGFQHRRLGDDFRTKRRIGDETDLCDPQVLPQALVVYEEERLVLLDGTAEVRAKLMQREGWDGGAIERRAGIQRIVPCRIKRAAVKRVGSGLRNHVDLNAAGRAAFRGVDRRADAELGDRIEGDVQPRFRLLRLLLNTVVVDAVESVVGIVDRVTIEPNAALRAVTVVNRAGRQHHQTGPVTAADRNLLDLLFFDQPTDFRRGAV